MVLSNFFGIPFIFYLVVEQIVKTPILCLDFKSSPFRGAPFYKDMIDLNALSCIEK